MANEQTWPKPAVRGQADEVFPPREQTEVLETWLATHEPALQITIWVDKEGCACVRSRSAKDMPTGLYVEVMKQAHDRIDLLIGLLMRLKALETDEIEPEHTC